MMNDEITKLQNRITTLENENLSLKRKIDDLEKALELAGSNIVLNEEVNITNYYLKKYLEIHNAILKERLEEINNKKNKLQKEYDDIINQENQTEVIASQNASTLNRIEEIDRLIEHKYYELEQKRFDFENEVNEIVFEETQVKNDSNATINEIIAMLQNKAQIEGIIALIDQTTIIIPSTLYPKNIALINSKEKMINKLKELNELENKIKLETKNLQAEKKSLQDAIQTVSLEALEAMLDQIVTEINRLDKQSKEISDLFTSLKEQNLKQLVDDIHHYQVLEMTNKDIAYEMDKILEKYIASLKIMDTQSNIRMKKMVELSELTSKKVMLDETKNTYDTILSEYQHLETLYETINKNIERLEDYLKMASNAISTKPEYETFINKYVGLINTIDLINKSINEINAQLKSLKEERRLKAIDIYAKDSVIAISEKIKEMEIQLVKYQNDLKEKENLFSTLQADTENLKLIAVYKNKQTIEKNITKLYNQQHDLALIMDDKYQEVKNLEDKLKDYDMIVNQIAELEHEVNHQ